MASAVQKITLAPSRDIPFNKLLLSQANVRRIKAGVSIEELAEDIARRGLLQGLSVRAVLDADGAPTDMFEIPAGGRRYRALELLVKQKRLAKTAPVPCIVREGGLAEEDSLAENVQRAPLHPLDQFRAFLALREKGQSEEEIAAAFFVSVNVVRQRLKLASLSPKLLDAYAEDGLTLDQLMAFTVSSDFERQEQVFECLQASYDKQPYVIRRMLTEGAVRASDKRARFIGIDAYVEAGGPIMRDLFQGDDGGSAEAARRLFAMAQPIWGTLVETYLRKRGLTLLHGTGSLRFHPRCYYRPDHDAPTETWPAMIAAVTDLDGRITGAHRTWLAPDGSDKAPIDTQRKAMGDLLGHAVRFGVPGSVMAAGEGIETMLSLRQVLPDMAMAPALSAAHLAAIQFPAALRRLYIVRDNDPAGDGARDSLVARANAEGIEAIPLSPVLGDFNEDLRLLGIDALRTGVRVQLAPEDVAGFLAV